MAYNILKTDGTLLITLPADSVSPAGSVLDLTLFGKGKLDYGEKWNENFVHLTENFANTTEPLAPLEGQLWFDQSGSPPNNLINYRASGAWEAVASQAFVSSEIGALLGSPPGLGPLPWSGGAAPSGWLLCDGQDYDPVVEPALFAEIGVTYNTGGETPGWFRVPDMRGRFPLGLNNTGSAVNRVNRAASQVVGGIDGDDLVTLITNELPPHNHTATIAASGSHSHTGATTNSTGSHQHSITFLNESNIDGGGSRALSDLLAGSSSSKLTTAAGNHSHTVTVPTSGSAHTHAITVGNTGSGSAHENTPPFVTVQYIIKT